MILSEILLVAFATFLAGLFVWKARHNDAISWLSLGIITVLGGWCALLLWHHSCISSSISTYETAVKILSDQNAQQYLENNPKIKEVFKFTVDSHPRELNIMLMNHYRIFTGFGWLYSTSYFITLSAVYGIYKLIKRPKN